MPSIKYDSAFEFFRHLPILVGILLDDKFQFPDTKNGVMLDELAAEWGLKNIDKLARQYSLKNPDLRQKTKRMLDELLGNSNEMLRLTILPPRDTENESHETKMNKILEKLLTKGD